jgi:glycosyltransferase involved in cell wall biosynthesis
LARSFDRMERRDYGIHDLIVTVAEADAASIRECYSGTLAAIPVPLARGVPPASAPKSGGPLRALLGGFFENEAIASDMKRFLAAWRVSGGVEGVELCVWGRGAVRAGLAPFAAQAGARILEWVPRPQQLLDSASIYVYPQRFACGVQTKIQEAMAAGLCVIAGRDTLEPVGARDGIEAIRAEGPEEAAASLERAAKRGLASLTSIGQNARALAAREFTVEAVSAKLAALLGWPTPEI